MLWQVIHINTYIHINTSITFKYKTKIHFLNNIPLLILYLTARHTSTPGPTEGPDGGNSVF